MLSDQGPSWAMVMIAKNKTINATHFNRSLRDTWAGDVGLIIHPKGRSDLTFILLAYVNKARAFSLKPDGSYLEHENVAVLQKSLFWSWCQVKQSSWQILNAQTSKKSVFGMNLWLAEVKGGLKQNTNQCSSLKMSLLRDFL